jgi:hypothetical protein
MKKTIGTILAIIGVPALVGAFFFRKISKNYLDGGLERPPSKFMAFRSQLGSRSD